MPELINSSAHQRMKRIEIDRITAVLESQGWLITATEIEDLQVIIKARKLVAPPK